MKYITKETHYGSMITLVPETEEEIQEMKEQEEWNEKVSCHCKKDHGSYFVPDNKNKECMKHHYRCRKCDKITQIG